MINNLNILKEWFKIYEGDFIKYKRWDDGWIFKKVLEIKEKYSVKRTINTWNIEECFLSNSKNNCS